MGDRTRIEWCDATWNPTSGCTNVSEGCVNCYAKRMAGRRMHEEWREEIPYVDAAGDSDTRLREFSDVRCHPDRLTIPLHWRKPRTVFVGSMSDLFHEDVPDDFIDRTFAVMVEANQHTYLTLTKRADRMCAYMTAPGVRDRIARYVDDGPRFWPPPNVWPGVTAENQQRADERIPLLLQTPAVLRFISCEPLLGEINLRNWLKLFRNDHIADPTGVAYNSVEWVIAGGETGPRWARTAIPDHFRKLRDQCCEAGVPFFLKQITANGRKVGCELDGREWKEFPNEAAA